MPGPFGISPISSSYSPDPRRAVGGAAPSLPPAASVNPYAASVYVPAGTNPPPVYTPDAAYVPSIVSAPTNVAAAQGDMGDVDAPRPNFLNRATHWVHDQFVPAGGASASGPVAASVPTNGLGGNTADNFIRQAMRFLGQPYLYGGGHGSTMNSPAPVDCSGLVQQAGRLAGVNLDGTAASQQRQGRAVSMSSLQPGDLVFHGNPASHVGIYIGGGKVLHAPHTGSKVQIVDLSSYHYFDNARRVFNQPGVLAPDTNASRQPGINNNMPQGPTNYPSVPLFPGQPQFSGQPQALQPMQPMTMMPAYNQVMSPYAAQQQAYQQQPYAQQPYQQQAYAQQPYAQPYQQQAYAQPYQQQAYPQQPYAQPYQQQAYAQQPYAQPYQQQAYPQTSIYPQASVYPAAAPQYAAPQYAAPQYAAPQYTAPQYAAPQYAAPQYAAPQYATPQYATAPNPYGYGPQTASISPALPALASMNTAPALAPLPPPPLPTLPPAPLAPPPPPLPALPALSASVSLPQLPMMNYAPQASYAPVAYSPLPAQMPMGQPAMAPQAAQQNLVNVQAQLQAMLQRR